VYNRSALVGTYQAGDPFLGGIIKGVGKIAGGFLTGGPLGAIGAGVGLIGGKPKRQQRQQRRRRGRPQRPMAGFGPIGPIAGIPGALPGPGSSGMPDLGGEPPARRRMNYSNQKALRRALRRATGFARQNKAVRKAAGEFAREFGPKRSSPRRDVGRGHVHVR
jgi:hypothetical protein